MAYGDDSEKIRKRAWETYIEPQVKQGVKRISLHIKPLMKEMESEGFPANHPRQFCKALQKRGFLEEKGLVLDHVDGPPSGTSTRVILHYRVTNDVSNAYASVVGVEETSKERAHRLVGKLRGLLKDELAEYGGGEAFIKWMRSEDEDVQ
jgi:hypothetical protein